MHSDTAQFHSALRNVVVCSYTASRYCCRQTT